MPSRNALRCVLVAAADPMLPLLDAVASRLDPFSSQLSDGLLAPAVSCDNLVCTGELVLRATVGRIHGVVRGVTGPMGGRQFRPDPPGRS